MQIRLLKGLEDLSKCYDETVRTTTNVIVQIQYGYDGFTQLRMEGKNAKM